MHVVKQIGLGALVIVALVPVFFVTALLTEFILVPWDTAITRPEMGTLARTVNDFFEVAPGSFLIPAMIALVGGVLSLRALRRDASVRALLKLFGGHLLFAAGLLILSTLAFMITNWLHPYPPVTFDPTFHGYHRSILPGIAVLALIVGWIWAQNRLFKHTTG
ncbi:MAG: hypothetical protein IT320_26765 [Anaerolineae bacterium]|nr:hypothetical protein [Anaerolineae bacterium]